MTIEELQTRWNDACAQGDHAAAYSIEQEIDALGRQAKREAVQHEADKAAKKALTESVKALEKVADAPLSTCRSGNRTNSA